MSDNIYDDKDKEVVNEENIPLPEEVTDEAPDKADGYGIQEDSVREESSEEYIPSLVIEGVITEEATEEKKVDEVLTAQLSEYEYDASHAEEEISADGNESVTAEEASRDSQQEEVHEKYDPRFSKPPKKEKKTKPAKSGGTLKGIALVSLCLVFSLIGSFIGGYYGMNKAMQSQGGTVLYQAVERTDKEGNTLTSPLSIEDVAETVKASVVEITTETVQESWFIQQYVTEGAGSGVIISKDGYIVTNNHVIEGVSSIRVRLVDGTEYDATLIGTDSKTDLAVIKIEAENLSSAVFGMSGSLKVGQSVVAVGNPLGELGGTVTDGIISALEREMTIEGEKMNLLQTNAAVNPGNSGGGLFNLYGELVGIVNAKTSGSGIEGLGFAIPIDDAKDVIEELIDLGYVSGRAYMGVTLLDINDYMTAASYRVNRYGVYILSVQEDSPAFSAGLRAGDYVEGIDDVIISSSNELTEYVGSKSIGDTVTMHIARDSKRMDIQVTLGEFVPATNIN